MPTVSLTDTMNDYLSAEPEFRRALLREIVSCFVLNQVEDGTLLLQKYIEGTIGFASLEAMLQRPAGSLQRALSGQEQLSLPDAFAMLAQLEKAEGIVLDVVERAA